MSGMMKTWSMPCGNVAVGQLGANKRLPPNYEGLLHLETLNL